MINTIVLLQFNNYFNRITQLENSLSDYIDKSSHYASFEKINFVPGDGVYTDQIINFNEYWRPDYMLVLDGDDIISRWYVIDSVRTRNGQYKLNLKRDSIADNYLDVISSPVYIEKATVDDGDTAIYNREDLDVSQIKVNETTITDIYENCACIVGYVDRNNDDTEMTFNIKQESPNFNYVPEVVQQARTNANFFRFYRAPAFSVTDRTDTDLAFLGTIGGADYQDALTGRYLTKVRATYDTGSNNEYDYPYLAYADSRGGIFGEDEKDVGSDNMDDEDKSKSQYYSFLNYIDVNKNTILAYSSQAMRIKKNASDQSFAKYDDDDLYAIYNGKTFVENGSYYRIHVDVEIRWEFSKISPTTDATLYELFENWQGTNTLCKVNMYSPVAFYTVTTELIGNNIDTTWQMTFPKSADATGGRIKCQDAVYDMFVIPYSGPWAMETSSQSGIFVRPDLSLKIATQIATALGGHLLDLQLLPYNPLPDVYITSVGQYPAISNTCPKTAIKTGGGVTSYMLYWSERCKFSKTIEISIRVDNIKESNCLDMYRIVSPNGNGAFEFSPAMNRGVDYFKVDCMYQPSNPYIRVAPNFKAQYGSDFNDKRGLICGGDFSLPHVIDKWVEYQNQNKYYQAIFDRQIENMEFNNKWQLAEAITGSVTGVATGAVAGAAAGSIVPGIGTAVGAIGGGIASAVGGGLDIARTIETQKENLDYTKDLFNLNLKTIQAMPTSVSKLSILDPNYKVYPVLEKYTCSEEERQAFRNKIKYNGMKVGRIGRISEYLRDEPTYIKGKLIRMEGSNNDFHEVNDIATELNKGVFIK